MITPQRLAGMGSRLLAAAGDPKVARQAATYFKSYDRVSFLGVATADVRKIAGDLHAPVGKSWGLDEATAFCDRLLRRETMEEKNLGIFILYRSRRFFERKLLRNVRSWLVEDLCDNWAATDALCTCVVSPLLVAQPDLAGIVAGWRRSRSLWLRRTSAVGLISLARRGRELDTAYSVAASLLGDREDLIHKATGWLLREAGKTDMSRLEAFLLRHGPRIPRTALRYAAERFPERRRREILTLTKAIRPSRGSG